MSDEREDVTPDPEDGSATGDSAESPAADPPEVVEEAGDTPNGDTPNGDAQNGDAQTARPAGKRHGVAKSSRTPAGADAHSAKRGGSRSSRPGTKGRVTPGRSRPEAPRVGNPIARILRYLREVAAELRKVIWPTRNELITYTAVVLVFVSFMVALTSGLDLVFARSILLVFG